MPFNNAPIRRGRGWEDVLSEDDFDLVSKTPQFDDPVYCNLVKHAGVIPGLWKCRTNVASEVEGDASFVEFGFD